jgi:hypothetical protein
MSKTTLNLETGTYELIRNRLRTQAEELRDRLQRLNAARGEVFGATPTELIANDRINTDNYCVARDIFAHRDFCLFGYNVHVGLRSGIALTDVFSGYTFTGEGFREGGLGPLEDEQFRTDFQNLYRYYKEAYFARFVRQEHFLYMVFHLDRKSTDFKTFKWLLTDEGMEYIDNRSDHEIRVPEQYEFRWKHAGRDDHRSGKHPHVSILDRVFVETVGGDLTIKVEDNTDAGRGIYTEPVEHRDQTLDDAEFAYADLGNLIVLRIRPYQEAPRYFVFNEKMQSVARIDALARSGVLLPEGHGLIFANGYYLQTGEYKQFDAEASGMRFERRIVSPNGEDYLYVFSRPESGQQVLLRYNIIEQEVPTPIGCSGFTLFPGGELAYFRAEAEPTKHHLIQLWQTPFTAAEQLPDEHADSYIYKVGNKDLVRAMAECREILTLTGKEDSYGDLYAELTKRATDVLDSYYWLNRSETFRLDEPLSAIREIANTAIGEYERKERLRRDTADRVQEVTNHATAVLDRIRRASFDRIEEYVQNLAELRTLRGEIVGLQDLPYAPEDQIETLRERTTTAEAELSDRTVTFLLGDEALAPYRERITAEAEKITELATARAATELSEAFAAIGRELELLIEIVSNLKIEDATDTTRVIEQISTLFTELNQQQAAVKQRRQQFQSAEATAEFAAQMKLLDQTVVNYLDVTATPAQCDSYLGKLMVQLEELEARFTEIDAFVTALAEKREEVYAAFESRRNALVEARNNRTAALAGAAERILNGIRKRAEVFTDETEINAYFAGDLMVDKVRSIVRQLQDLEDSNKANAIQTQLNTLREEATRGLRDRQELYADGQQTIRLGRHRFPVNAQPLELTIVRRDDGLYFHLTGTGFYDRIDDEALNATQPVWDMATPAENDTVYRAEYLAWRLFRQREQVALPASAEELRPLVQAEAARHYTEGYTKGVHDEDATRILAGLLAIEREVGLLRYPAAVRAYAQFFWTLGADDATRKRWLPPIRSAAAILEVFPQTHTFDYLIEELATELRRWAETSRLFDPALAPAAADYLFRELATDDHFVVAPAAAQRYDSLMEHLRKQKSVRRFEASLRALAERPADGLRLARRWVEAFLETSTPSLALPLYGEGALPAGGGSVSSAQDKPRVPSSRREANAAAPSPAGEGRVGDADIRRIVGREVPEVALLLLQSGYATDQVLAATTSQTLADLRGQHPRVSEDGSYVLDYHDFTARLAAFDREVVPLYTAFAERKRTLTAEYREQLRLDELRPRVLSSFVRNRLIDEVYLPLFGDNFAKQLGTAGADTRTDRMGLLLLISPPGYGKTTLMEYLANRLGLIFVKVNGPALGHRTHSLAPEDAPTLAARQELEKLNLALEMGDNVMLYVDDIQHCDPEFLQKFISLCDAQRKIEGVFGGKSKTYDLRGKRFCVVMAGNPFTEEGTRFQLPDMLANRADIYNLGDIIGGSRAAFELSYIENALTSNSTLRRLATHDRAEVHELIQSIAAGTAAEGVGSFAGDELKDYSAVLERLLSVRDTILEVNQAYIRSAATADAYRTAPPFRLQGSYRDMNKLAEKISPLLNEAELRQLLLSHYTNESQTLRDGAEANLLQLKELLGWLTPDERQRWEAIKAQFQHNLRAQADGAEQVARAVREGLAGVRAALRPGDPSPSPFPISGKGDAADGLVE